MERFFFESAPVTGLGVEKKILAVRLEFRKVVPPDPAVISDEKRYFSPIAGRSWQGEEIAHQSRILAIARALQLEFQ